VVAVWKMRAGRRSHLSLLPCTVLAPSSSAYLPFFRHVCLPSLSHPQHMHTHQPAKPPVAHPAPPTHLSPSMSASSIECVVSTMARPALHRCTSSHRWRLAGGRWGEGRGGGRRGAGGCALAAAQARCAYSSRVQACAPGAHAQSRPPPSPPPSSPADGVQPCGRLIQVDNLGWGRGEEMGQGGRQRRRQRRRGSRPAPHAAPLLRRWCRHTTPPHPYRPPSPAGPPAARWPR
jgi:hypothetical protein